MSAPESHAGSPAPHFGNRQDNPTVGPLEGQGYDTAAGLPKPLASFFKGEPEALGATQIFAGVVILIFGIALLVTTEPRGFDALAPVIFSGLPFWSGIMYITSGSLSVAASVKPTLGKVRASLVLNIISSLAAGIGIIMLLISLSISSYMYRIQEQCVYQPNGPCIGEFNSANAVRGFVLIIFLLTLLMFCITISSSVFGCKATCRTAFTEVHMVLYQTAPVNAPDTTAEASPLPSTSPITIFGSST
ncbi:membrane-spanning 4-domains subfamily A member 4A-like [Mantella aurantiaca]